ncbi:MAG: IspD/TarI family cytidylyltransferase [Candidatus Eiseniibacteriota bacterium]
MEQTALIVVAAGRGERLAAGVDKPYVEVAGRPLIGHCLARLDVPGLFAQRIVVIAPGSAARFRDAVLGRLELAHSVELVDGGATRQASVERGLRAVAAGIERVAIHDGARAAIDPATVRRTIDGCEGVDGACAALPVHDALKRGGDDGLVEADVERLGLWRAQTPQTFWLPVIRAAHEAARVAAAARPAATAGPAAAARPAAAAEHAGAADDVSLVLQRGGRVRLVPGSPTNIKVTTAADLALLALYLIGGATGEPRGRDGNVTEG